MRTTSLAALATLSLVGCPYEHPNLGVEPPPIPDEYQPFRRVPAAPRFATRAAPHATPALSGGTLLALRGSAVVAASDPDHDAVWVVDLRGDAAPRRIALQPGDEPGRLAQDDAGLVHVALRGGGAVATIDPVALTVAERRAVCPAPRGIAWDASRAALHVACAGGELVTLPSRGTAAASVRLDADLRDVVVRGVEVYVSRFRAASIDRVEFTDGRATGAAPVVSSDPSEAVMWRMSAATGGLVTLTQSVQNRRLGGASREGYYGSVDDGRVPLVPHVRTVGVPIGAGLDVTHLRGGLTVDIAAMLDGDRWHVAVASPGWAFRQGMVQVHEWTTPRGGGSGAFGEGGSSRSLQVSGQAVAVAYTAQRELVVQTRAPGRIVTPTREIALYDDEVADVGHDIFHASTSSGLACASCHPEGHDDGQVWGFPGERFRRTQSLRGEILQTAPFHWDGDLPDMAAVGAAVYTARMGGGTLYGNQAERLGRWVDGLRAYPGRAPDDAAVLRGSALFGSPEAGCANCHQGPMLTNNQSVDVGTGGRFQVPSLVGLMHRAPYLHDGCAPTLAALLAETTCGGASHGRAGRLSAAQRADLTAFLESR